MKLITDTAKLKAAFDSIAKRGAKLDNDIWIAAVSAMAHHDKHGDVTIINDLVAAMPKGSRVNALREFISAFGKVVYDTDNKVFMHDKTGNFDLEGAISQSWTEFKPEPPYQPIDALALIKKLAVRIQKADASKGDKVTNKQAQAVMRLAADLGVELPVAKDVALKAAPKKPVEVDPLMAEPNIDF